MLRWPSSLRFRLTLWYAFFLGLPLIGLAVACYLVFARTLQARTDEFIGDALTAFTRELGAERRASLTALDAVRSTANEVRFRDLHIAILDSSGMMVATNTAFEADDPEDAAPARDLGSLLMDGIRGHALTDTLVTTVQGDGKNFRLMLRPVRLEGGQFAVTGMYSLADIEETLERIRAMFLIAVPLLIGCAATGGYFLAKRGLAPVSSMAAHAAKISATSLSERFPVEGGDELEGLARMVNELLDRLEQSFEQQRRFVADASHELRTPTAILRAEAEVTLSRERRNEEEYRASVAVMRDASRRLARIVDDLFLLARSDSGHVVARFEALYLEDMIDDATRAVRSVAEQRGVRVHVRPLIEAPVHGDADLIGRLLLNLLDNAIKYSPVGGTVEVELVRTGADYVVDVADAGEGIPGDVQQRIFERFFRVDSARSRNESSSTSGAGLGLSIARRIAEMHAGRLELAESRPGRTVFRMVLPADPEPTEPGEEE